ncbi:MAG: hypothetical protein Q8O88_01905 [bacterium]|nr:hypothetical protein [bacterium]
MTTRELTKLRKLENEVKILRSLLISVAGKDNEGVYRSSFVKKLTKTIADKPIQKFKNKKSFLAQLKEL